MPRPATSGRPGRLRALLEIGLVLAIFVADWRHLIPFSKTPFLLVVGGISLRSRGLTWKDVGLTRFRGWTFTLAAGIAGGIAMELAELFLTQPLLVRLIGEQPDLSDFRALRGNPGLLALGLLLAWSLAAFGEECVYRGYLLNRVADLTGRARAGWAASLLLVSVAFGFAHTYQGPTGVIEAGIDGLFLGLLYLGCGGNLAVPIVAHGVQDTIDVVLIFLGKYPGL